MNWKDFAHYGTAALLMLIGGAAAMGVSLPGVQVSDPKTVFLAGLGVFAAGLKGGWSSK